MEANQEDRWALAKHLIDNWWPPLTEADRVPEAELSAAEVRLGITLPLALREWYLMAGRRRDFIGNEDHILRSEQIHFRGQRVVFWWENQVVFDCGFHLNDLHLADPPVLADRHEFCDFPEDLPYPTPDSGSDRLVLHETEFSRFITDLIVEATIMCGEFVAEGTATGSLLSSIQAQYSLRYHARAQLRSPIYEDDETLIAVSCWGHRDFVLVAARSRAAFDRFLLLPGDNWGNPVHQNLAWNATGHTLNARCSEVLTGGIRGRSLRVDDAELEFMPAPACDSDRLGAIRTRHPPDGTVEEHDIPF